MPEVVGMEEFLNGSWVEGYAAGGVRELESLLDKHRRFAEFLHQTGRGDAA